LQISPYEDILLLHRSFLKSNKHIQSLCTFPMHGVAVKELGGDIVTRVRSSLISFKWTKRHVLHNFYDDIFKPTQSYIVHITMITSFLGSNYQLCYHDQHLWGQADTKWIIKVREQTQNTVEAEDTETYVLEFHCCTIEMVSGNIW